MRRKTALPELLAPAGDSACLRAAVAAGADAIYLGGVRFGARAFAKNFDEESLRSAVRYAHSHGVRIYVTLNTLIYDKELCEAVEYAKSLHGMGVDALIVADIGVISAIRRAVPELPLHASTQMGVHNLAGAEAAAALGCERVVLARECSSKDIGAITERSTAEIEVFLHGALCVCHSGQCLFSSLVGGRSGNRGECAQPCRLPYGNGYPLSLRDLSLAAHIPELIESGVSSLKIEGRMKSADYVYAVTAIYRRLLDEHRAATESEARRLAEIFSRGGFTDGYFTARTAKGMTGTRSSADKQASRELSGQEIPELKLPVSMSLRIVRGGASELTVSATVTTRCDGKCIAISEMVFGQEPTEAITSPLTEASVKERISKLGGTSFELAEDGFSLTLDDGLNLPPSAINALRRDAVEKLNCKLSFTLDTLTNVKKRGTGGVLPKFEQKVNLRKIKRSLLLLEPALFDKIGSECCNANVDIIFVPLFSYRNIKDKTGVGLYLPPVVMESEWERALTELDLAIADGADTVLIGNISWLAAAAERGMRPVLDFRMNITNSETKRAYEAMGVESFILSPELTLPMARDIGGSVITLGRIPLMLTERCFIKDSFGCDSCGKARLRDRTGAAFPMVREWEHRNLILNSLITYMGDRQAELDKHAIRSTHFIISVEGAKEACDMLRAYRTGKPLAAPHRRIGSRRS